MSKQNIARNTKQCLVANLRQNFDLRTPLKMMHEIAAKRPIKTTRDTKPKQLYTLFHTDINIPCGEIIGNYVILTNGVFCRVILGCYKHFK